MRPLRPAAVAVLLLAAPAWARAAEPAPREAEPARPAARSAPAAEASPSPYAAVRALQALQDQVAHGSTAAQSGLPRAMARVAEVFAAADPGVWKEKRNAAAAALFLFSAGRPGAVRAAIDRGASFTPEGDRLVKGALAYAEAQDDVARALLGAIDPKSLPASLGGHLALVQATLFAADPAKADAMLDAARLMVPGTLVEEAALRRQIFLLAEPTTLDKFASLSRQYIRRFRGSVFADNFKARLTSFAVKLAVSGELAGLARLDPVLAELPQGERRSLYLTLSRDALVAGRPEVARVTAARAAGLAPDPADAERARLYAAAATAASDAAPAARTALASIDASRLSGRDLALRDAAAAVAGAVDGGLGDRGRAADAAAAPMDARSAELIARARAAVAAGDALLAVDPGLPGGDRDGALPPAAGPGRRAP